MRARQPVCVLASVRALGCRQWQGGACHGNAKIRKKGALSKLFRGPQSSARKCRGRLPTLLASPKTRNGRSAAFLSIVHESG